MPRKELADYDDDKLACRGINHPWKLLEYKDFPKDRPLPEFGTAVWYECRQCHSRFMDVYDTYGRQVRNRRYFYADGYLRPGSDLERGDYRIELLKRRGIITLRQRRAG